MRRGPGLGAFTTGMTGKVGLWTLRVTCARDGREHQVSDREMDAGHTGPRVALCGHEVLPAVLVCPPGPPCSGCIAVRWQDTDARDPGVDARVGIAGREYWPGWSPGCGADEDHGEAKYEERQRPDRDGDAPYPLLDGAVIHFGRHAWRTFRPILRPGQRTEPRRYRTQPVAA